jgi:hypothetical protein
MRRRPSVTRAHCPCPTGCDAIGSKPLPRTSTCARLPGIVSYKKSQGPFDASGVGRRFFSAKRAFAVGSALLKCTYQRVRDYGVAASLSNGRAMAASLASAGLALFQTAAAGQHRTQCGGLTDAQALTVVRHSLGRRTKHVELRAAKVSGAHIAQ